MDEPVPHRRMDDRLGGMEERMQAMQAAMLSHLESERRFAVELTRLTGVVDTLVHGMERLEVRDAEQQYVLHELNSTISQARGGWRALLVVGGIVGTIGAVVAFGWNVLIWVYGHLKAG